MMILPLKLSHCSQTLIKVTQKYTKVMGIDLKNTKSLLKMDISLVLGAFQVN